MIKRFVTSAQTLNKIILTVAFCFLMLTDKCDVNNVATGNQGDFEAALECNWLLLLGVFHEAALGWSVQLYLLHKNYIRPFNFKWESIYLNYVCCLAS